MAVLQISIQTVVQVAGAPSSGATKSAPPSFLPGQCATGRLDTTCGALFSGTA